MSLTVLTKIEVKTAVSPRWMRYIGHKLQTVHFCQVCSQVKNIGSILKFDVTLQPIYPNFFRHFSFCGAGLALTDAGGGDGVTFTAAFLQVSMCMYMIPFSAKLKIPYESPLGPYVQLGRHHPEPPYPTQKLQKAVSLAEG